MLVMVCSFLPQSGAHFMVGCLGWCGTLPTFMKPVLILILSVRGFDPKRMIILSNQYVKKRWTIGCKLLIDIAKPAKCLSLTCLAFAPLFPLHLHAYTHEKSCVSCTLQSSEFVKCMKHISGTWFQNVLGQHAPPPWTPLDLYSIFGTTTDSGKNSEKP